MPRCISKISSPSCCTRNNNRNNNNGNSSCRSSNNSQLIHHLDYEHNVNIMLQHRAPTDLTTFIEKGAENMIINKMALYQLLEKSYLNQPCPVCKRKASIFIDEFRSKGGACTFVFSCHGRDCIFKEQLRTSAAIMDEDGHRTRMAELPARMVYSFLIAGLSFRNYEEVLDLLGVQHFGDSQFKVYVDKLTTVVNDLLQEKLRSQREHFKSSSRHYVVVDGRWSCRGWKANECTVSFFDADSNELLHVEHVLRKMTLQDKHGSYVGASSSMEGIGLDHGMRLFQQEGIMLDGIVHDHDGETMKIVGKYFPSAIEMNDPAHRVKLFKKKIISLGSLHKQLKGLGNKCSRMLMYSIRHCDGQFANFKQLMKNQFNHITNRDHSCLLHS